MAKTFSECKFNDYVVAKSNGSYSFDAGIEVNGQISLGGGNAKLYVDRDRLFLKFKQRNCGEVSWESGYLATGSGDGNFAPLGISTVYDP